MRIGYKIFLLMSLTTYCNIDKNEVDTIDNIISPPKPSISTTLTKSIIHNDIKREYIIHIPGKYSKEKQTPLLFCFHGYSSSANTIMLYSNFNEIADTAGFIVAYPQGALFHKSNKTHFNVGGFTKGSLSDDVDFTRKLIDSISLEYNVDQRRIYSTGMSNGGFMSFLLACQLSDKIAAIASVTGSMSPEIFEQCNPKRPIPIMIIHGDKDRIVPYRHVKYKRNSKSIPEVLNYWVNHNNCGEICDTIIISNVNKQDSSHVHHIIYSNEDSKIDIEHLKIVGGYHSWPGIKEDFDIHQNDEIETFFTRYNIRVNMDINASKEIWKFFSKYDINGRITKN